MIAYPENLNQAFPMISWQHGTEVRRQSVSSNNGFNVLSLWLTTRGYIFLEPDYLGLGESEILHPYCMKDPSAWTTIDLIRSAQIFFDNEEENFYYPITTNNDLILYSEIILQKTPASGVPTGFPSNKTVVQPLKRGA